MKISETTSASGERVRFRQRNPRVFIYFVGTEGGPIKIGKAKNVKARLAGIQTGSPYKLEILGVMMGRESLEGALHKRFSKHRLEGEWFARCDEILEFIANHTLASEFAYLKRLDDDAGVQTLKEELSRRNAELKKRMKMEERERVQAARKAVVKRLSRLITEMVVGAWAEQVVAIRDIVRAIESFNEEMAEESGHRIRDALVFDPLRTSVRRLIGCDWRQAQHILLEKDLTNYDLRDALRHDASRWFREYAGSLAWVDREPDEEGDEREIVTAEDLWKE